MASYTKSVTTEKIIHTIDFMGKKFQEIWDGPEFCRASKSVMSDFMEAFPNFKEENEETLAEALDNLSVLDNDDLIELVILLNDLEEYQPSWTE